MAQSWHDLLFAHWPVPADGLRALLPAGLALDTTDGQAWLGVVPFRMSGVRPRWLPALPGLSAFPELNVRTYVVADGKPGVWFFSLDAANRVAVELARRSFHLPYFRALMRCSAAGEGIEYRTERHDPRGAPAVFAAHYEPFGPAAAPAPGSLADWLTARYCLYTSDSAGRLLRGEIHHLPWPLQAARADIRANSMAEAAGIRLPETAPLLHFARRLDVVVWPLEPVSSAALSHPA
jgi:uncharacterized protein YqjF (DUF2071 family)